MKKNDHTKQRWPSQREVEELFDKMDDCKRNFTPTPSPKQNDTSQWITTSNSSKGDNKLTTVAAWQIGQKS